MKLQGDVIGLDLGIARTGVARVSVVAQIAQPLSVINMKTDELTVEIEKVVNEYEACAVVAGVPRGLDGQITEQTLWAQALIDDLSKELTVPVFAIDEAGTTVEAEHRATKNVSVDCVAAGIIAENFLQEVMRGKVDNVTI